MSRTAPRVILIVMLLALAACQRAPNEPGRLSPDDAAQLDNAAEMLDASPDGLTAPPDENAASPANAS